MTGPILDTGMLILVGSLLWLALFGWGAYALSRRYGGTVWLIALVLIPFSVGLVIPESYAAWGALAMLIGLVAPLIAVAIAIGMLHSAHLYAAESLKSSLPPRRYGEKWFRGGDLQRYQVWFLVLSGVFVTLCVWRALILGSFFFGTILSALGGLIFLGYPIVSLILGHAWARAMNACTQHEKRYLENQTAWAANEYHLQGSDMDQWRRLKRVNELASQANLDPNAVLKQQAKILNKMGEDQAPDSKEAPESADKPRETKGNGRVSATAQLAAFSDGSTQQQVRFE